MRARDSGTVGRNRARFRDAEKAGARCTSERRNRAAVEDDADRRARGGSEREGADARAAGAVRTE